MNFRILNHTCLAPRTNTMRTVFLIAILALGSMSCTDEQFLIGQEVAAEIVPISLDEPTYLRVVNELEEDFYSINAVELGHYSFKKLNIS